MVVTVYDHLVTRSGFDQTLTGPPTGVLDQTLPIAVSSLPSVSRGAPGELDVKVEVEPTATATPAPPSGVPTIVLDCQPDTGTCPGVYPVVVSLTSPTGTVVASFTTYLTYVEANSPDPLHFAWVVPIAAPLDAHAAADASASQQASTGALPSVSTQALSQLVASLRSYDSVPTTLEASPQTLQALRASGNSGRLAVSELGAMSASQSVHQFLAQSYAPINLGELAAAGETTEIEAQMVRGSTALQHLGIQVSPTQPTSSSQTPPTSSSQTPPTSTSQTQPTSTSQPAPAGTTKPTSADGPMWVATGGIGTALGSGLAQIAASDIVVPEGSLAPPTAPASSGTWTTTFNLALGKTTITAAASDDLLGAHFTSDPSDPVLEANQLLADLAMIHFEAPNTPQARGVVAVPPSDWQPNAAFDDTVLAGLVQNPNVEANTLAQFFAQVPGSSSTLPTRHLAQSGPGPTLPASFAHELSQSRLRLSAFDTSVRSDPSLLTHLDDLLLGSESSLLRPSQQQAGVTTFNRALDAQLDQISFGSERTITLTARTGAIPVTVLSTAPYAVTGTLTLTSDRFTFPQGTSQRLVIDHSTTPVRISVVARTSGDLPLEVTFESPTGRLRFASGELTIRSTATSVVGVVLTIAALAVLLGWWVRTWRSGRRRRAMAPDDRAVT